MLRTLSTTTQFRGLNRNPLGPTTAGASLGRRTIIYGRNGSGKTSFSELLRQGTTARAQEQVAVTAFLHHKDQVSKQSMSSTDFPLHIMVYNRFYVEESLALFLNGDGESDTILKLGKDNVAAARQLEILTQVERRYLNWTKSLQTLKSNENKSATEAITTVKDTTIACLGRTDPGKYGSATYTAKHAKKRLETTTASEVLSDADIESALAILGESHLEPAPAPTPFPYPSDSLASRVKEALERDASSSPITDLVTNIQRSNWTEQGLRLHIIGDTCKFCREGSITQELVDKYRAHFSKDLDDLRKDLASLVTEIEEYENNLNDWQASIQPAASLLPEHRAKYAAITESIAAGILTIRNNHQHARAELQARLADPLERRTKTEVQVGPATPLGIEKLSRTIADNSNDSSDQIGRRHRAQERIEKHFAAKQATAYHAFIARAVRAEACLTLFEAALSRLHQERRILEQSQQDTGYMATKIHADLREHFGLTHLTISVSADNTGYVILRNGNAAKHLSEGERNAIAFAYFLACLQEEGNDPSSMLVVVDDPVSSMDKESLFAAFALAEARTSSMAQTIFLTHDYEYFRLQLRQRDNALKKSLKKIEDGDKSEIAYPAVSVLEMVAFLTTSGTRVSHLRPLARELLKHPSEYHYLFSKIANATLRDADDELPLLGNAARRLLEGFIAFRAPHGSNFQMRVDSIERSKSIDSALSKRVVKFLHGHSHREDPNPVSALDFPSIEAELKAALSFIRQADNEHFDNMCSAVGIDVEALHEAIT